MYTNIYIYQKHIYIYVHHKWNKEIHQGTPILNCHNQK